MAMTGQLAFPKVAEIISKLSVTLVVLPHELGRLGSKSVADCLAVTQRDENSIVSMLSIHDACWVHNRFMCVTDLSLVHRPEGKGWGCT